MNKQFMNQVTREFNRALLKAKKFSPEILIIVGTVGVVASAVVACKATTKLSEIQEESKDLIDKIHEAQADETLVEKYTEDDSKKDLAIVYVQTGLKIAKLYAPAVVLGALSLTCIISSNNILRKRNVALAAAYATIDKSFKEYRGRVIQRFGKDIDRELKYDIKAETIQETVTDENGKEKTVSKTVQVVNGKNLSGYARLFNSAANGYEKNKDYNLMFIRSQETLANDLLIARGHIFLNEVYDMMGIDRSPEGQHVGWVYNTENPVGDNYVDFGIQEYVTKNEAGTIEECILLDFNVDGDILDLM